MKNLKNLGQALSKAEQKTINGGRHRNLGIFQACYNPSHAICDPYNADAACNGWETCVPFGSGDQGTCECNN